jgi:hypothetical protein
METVYDYSGVYGRSPRQGIISEHVYAALRAGFELRTGVDGDYVADSNGDTAPVLCSELVEVWDEDGPRSGRCGVPLTSSPP